MGWVWSGGSNLAPGPLGSVAGDPRPTGTGAGSSAPPPYRRLPAGGRGLRPRVCAARSGPPFASLRLLRLAGYENLSPS
jgi:hypothetical protein